MKGYRRPYSGFLHFHLTSVLVRLTNNTEVARSSEGDELPIIGMDADLVEVRRNGGWCDHHERIGVADNMMRNFDRNYQVRVSLYAVDPPPPTLFLLSSLLSVASVVLVFFPGFFHAGKSVSTVVRTGRSALLQKTRA